MKELRRNMRLVGMLVVVAFIGLAAWFALTVFEQGSIWASDSYNTRLRATGNQRGDILDRNGLVLATTEQGKRVYPEDARIRRALAATVGDTLGMSGTGVEGYFSSQLLDLSDSLVERLSALGGGERKGSSIQLTIDARLTAYVSEIFPAGYRGAVVIQNYATGEVLSWVSKPDYDPYDAGDASVEDTAYLNRCLQGLYTPGSVFKLVTLAAAIESDPNVLNQTFLCNGTWEYEGGKIVCAGKTAHGMIDLETALEKSCNVTFGKLAYQLGLDRLRATAEKLGFNENLKFEDFTIYNSQFPDSISNMSDLVWAGIGQGKVLVTPMHMAMITSAIANGGAMLKPTMVTEIRKSTGAITQGPHSPTYRQVISESAAQVISDYMYRAVQSGTAHRAAISGYEVCGKTGSAETSDDKTIETNSWYAGFIRDSRYPFSIAVVIEQGGAGSRLASELASDALEYAIHLNS